MKMTVETVRNEYRATLELVRGMKPKDVFMPHGAPIVAGAIRHYLSAMQVLFDQIATLTDQNERLEARVESLRVEVKDARCSHGAS